MIKILELGAGKNPYKPKKDEIVIHLDKVKLPDIEVIHDLNKFPYPFKDNEFDIVIANNVLEHLNDLDRVMREIWRILKPKGIFKVKVPYFAHPNAFTDHTHKHFFTLHSFDYWDNNTTLGKLYSQQASVRFKIKKKQLIFYGRKRRFFGKILSKLPYYEIYLSRIFPAEEIYLELEAIK